MEKYFVPNREDLYVGYECENLQKDGSWRYTGIQSGFSIDCVSSDINEGKIRTPYLTKEAISKELDLSIDINGFCTTDSVKDGFTWEVKTFMTNYQITYFEISHFLCIHAVEYINGELTQDKYGKCYTGNCKDINSFRTIIKLLKI